MVFVNNLFLKLVLQQIRFCSYCWLVSCTFIAFASLVTSNNSSQIPGLDTECDTTAWGEIDDQCMVIDSRNYKVLFGVEASPQRFPYLASLQVPILGRPGCYLHECGATFITSDLLLTAAHCIWGSENDWRDQIVPGIFDRVVYISQTPLCRHQKGQGRYPVRRYWLPEQYDPSGAGWDIAVLKLEKPAPVNQFVSFQAADSVNLSEPYLTVVGWGNSQPSESKLDVVQMRGAQLQLMNPAECQEKLLQQTGLKGPYNWDEEFCAFSQFTDTCGGDSGGPILLADRDGVLGGDPNRDIQVGIISWGPTRACSNPKIQYPGIYTRIDTKIDWIRNVITESLNEIIPPEDEDLEDGQVDCSYTQAGCKCAKQWDFRGINVSGCSNPEGDPYGNWCIFEVGSCTASSVGLGLSWDYCQEGC